MQRPWWPSALNPLGFVAHQASLGSATSSFDGPRGKLLTIIDTIDISLLRQEDQATFDWIDREKPWLLTDKEISLLRILQKRAA
jgi:hypothetical protein